MNREAIRIRKQSISRFISEGHSISEAVNKFSVSRTTVYQACHENAIKPPVSIKAPRPSAYNVLYEIIATDNSDKSISDKYNVTYQYIQQVRKYAESSGILGYVKQLKEGGE